jgi:DNA-binding beta-propeller fold protein YncE
MKKSLRLLLPAVLLFHACKKTDLPCTVNEEASTFTEISSTTIGKEGAAEITAFDPLTKKLFVVTNTGTSRIDVLSLADPAAPAVIGFIDIAPYGGGVNSVAVSEGHIAAAVEGFQKTDPGKAVIFKTTDYALVAQVEVGALPDMITYSPDGRYLLTANEGEPNDTYSIDPEGTVSIISVRENYAVTHVGFSSFATQKTDTASTRAKGVWPGCQLCAGHGAGIPYHLCRFKNSLGNAAGK